MVLGEEQWRVGTGNTKGGGERERGCEQREEKVKKGMREERMETGCAVKQARKACC